MRVYAAVLAAGSGSRFGADKVNLVVRGRPLWKWSYDALCAHPGIDGVGIVGSSAVLDSVAQIGEQPLFAVLGGSTRAESCHTALDALPSDADLILVHDGARPLVNSNVIDRVIEATIRTGAAAAALPVTDTVKRISNEGIETLDRTELRSMQTPQGVKVDLLKRAFEQAGAFDATDEMVLIEAMGVTPEIVEGASESVKVTRPNDLRVLSGLLGAPETRTGIGYDVHKFSSDANRPLWLGGVLFPGHVGLEGHSDADALLHAIVDAALGAAGLGDIGLHFPPSDPQWKDQPSATFLKFAALKLNNEGWKLRHIDATVIAESPKVMARATEIRAAIANACGIEISRVSVKATTNETLGAIGRGEGIAAFAVATIVQDP